MKKIVLTLIFCSCFINGFSQSVFNGAETTTEEVVEKAEVEEKKSHKFRLWIPAFTFDVFSFFIDKNENYEEKKLLKSLGNVSLFVLTNTDLSDSRVKHFQKKFDRKINRNGGEELIVVETPEAKIHISGIFDKKGNMDKVVVFINADDVFLFAKINGLPDIDYLNKLISE